MYHDSTVSMRILPGIMRVSVNTFLSLETKYQVLRATNSWDCGNSANKALMHPLLPEEFSCLPETIMAVRISIRAVFAEVSSWSIIVLFSSLHHPSDLSVEYTQVQNTRPRRRRRGRIAVELWPSTERAAAPEGDTRDCSSSR